MSSTVQPDAESLGMVGGVTPIVPPDGAVWRRVDLHLHTPGAHSFACPDGADLRSTEGRARLVDQYVGQLEAEGIAVCAVTDYNGVRTEWFKPIREEAGKRGIVVLPGAEVSFTAGKHGLHVLAVFSADEDPDGVNASLRSLDRNPGSPLFGPDRSHRDIVPKQNVIDALKELRRQYNCLLILPHADQRNGFCKTFSAVDAAGLLAEIRPDAMEHCSESSIHTLRSAGILPDDFFEHMAWVEFSDPKDIAEIGTKTRTDGSRRATYLKLSAMDLDALRLALHDPTTRRAVGNAPEATHARIQAMEISGSGFLGNLHVRWNDDLNVLIGGRGAGKSAVLETLRYGLDLPAYSEQESRSDLVRHALGSGGKVTLTLQRPVGNGTPRPYRIERVLGEEPRVYEVDTNRRIEVRPPDLFGPSGGPTVFGQREIYSVSGKESYRLRLLDDLIGEEAKQQAKRVRDAFEKLKRNGRAILERNQQLGKREEYLQRLKTIEHEITVYEQHGAAEKLKELTALRSDRRHLRGGSEAVVEGGEAWKRSREEVLPPLRSSAKALSSGTSKQKEILTEAAELIAELEKNLRKLFEEGDRLFSGVVGRWKELDERWNEALQPIEEELNRIKREARTDQLDPDRLLRLIEERTGLTPLLEQFGRLEEELNVLRTERSELLGVARQRRHEEHRLRRERASQIEAILGGRLRLGVEFKGHKTEYAERLKALLKGSGVSSDAVENLVAPEATDGISLGEAVREGPEEVQERFGITPAMAERLVKWLTDDEVRLFELETIVPEDDLRIHLVMMDEQARPLDRLSPGQRATAILLLLFAFEGRVLVLDQPEDDLDNRFVYEDVVQILRAQKGLGDARARRQVITATHNPNIPVLGDAELVIPLDAREGKAVVLERGSIDHRAIRERIKSIMEGGEEAFRRRAEKYGGVEG